MFLWDAGSVSRKGAGTFGIYGHLGSPARNVYSALVFKISRLGSPLRTSTLGLSFSFSTLRVLSLLVVRVVRTMRAEVKLRVEL